jgi:hypothetical protein
MRISAGEPASVEAVDPAPNHKRLPAGPGTAPTMTGQEPTREGAS